jgi:ABC-2 type transport system ATP-binding protein
MMTGGVETTALRRHFGSFKAVDGIDLAVAPGEIFGFLGPNGAGKTTTVRVLTTLLSPTSGSARVAGYDVVSQGAKVRASIGVALQEAGLDGLATGRELLRLHGRLAGLSRTDAPRRAAELVALVDLGEAADRRVMTYSGGMKRRLDLAAALVHRPQVLFLDEPTTGLDPSSRSIIWEQVRRLRADDGVTVFLTTQYLEEADVLADRVAIIDGGVIAAEGTPAALKAKVGTDVIRLETAGATADLCSALTAVPGVTGASLPARAWSCTRRTAGQPCRACSGSWPSGA